MCTLYYAFSQREIWMGKSWQMKWQHLFHLSISTYFPRKFSTKNCICVVAAAAVVVVNSYRFIFFGKLNNIHFMPFVCVVFEFCCQTVIVNNLSLSLFRTRPYGRCASISMMQVSSNSHARWFHILRMTNTLPSQNLFSFLFDAVDISKLMLKLEMSNKIYCQWPPVHVCKHSFDKTHFKSKR